MAGDRRAGYAPNVRQGGFIESGGSMNFNPFDLLVFAGVALVIGYPVWRMARRMGFGSDITPIIVIGCVLFPVLMLWIMAFKEWPALEEKA